MAKLRASDVHFTITPLEFAVLIYHFALAEGHKNIGHNDEATTYNELMKILNKGKVRVDMAMLEKLLYALNMCKEEGCYAHPENKTFEDFMFEVRDTPSTSKRYGFDPLLHHFIIKE